jgi:phthalate 4,5-dioxygenase oxygenase subunit
MISKEENDFLTLVEGDAPMGQMMRQNHWIPALRSGRLEADGDPIRVRLFGDDYVAFRATDGRVGFFDERCPHRGASLALARNEDCALRCIFHGWKFDVSGKAVEVPTHAGDQADFASKVPLKHYPTREAGRMLWVWLGDGEPARFPALPFTQLPDDHVFLASTKIPVNYLQGLEATLDSAHIPFLHRDWVGDLGDVFAATAENLAPRFELHDTPYGFKAAALREMKDGAVHARLNEFVLPFHSSTAPGSPDEGAYQILVPIDNVNTLWIFVRWNNARPLSDEESLLAKPGADLDNWVPPLGGPDEYWGQDRASMKTGSFAGFKDGLLTEDTVVQISMGPIADRTKEMLCSSDGAIKRTRQCLARAARDYAAGKRPLGTDPTIPYDKLYAVTGVMAANEDWRERFAG